jgi:formate dehydrogenase major subunit
VPVVVKLTIDGRVVEVPAGTTLWEAAQRAGIDIPVLCHSARLDPVGVCRMCVVDTGARVFAAACVRPCENGMKVDTASEKVERQRRMLTRLLLADHPTPCARERTTGDCDLEALGRRYGLVDGGPDTLPAAPLPRGHGRPLDASSPVIAVDHQACILCDRCIRACDDVQSNEVIGRTGKGYAARIAFDLDAPMGRSTCVSCGECVASCPTGALTNKAVAAPIRATRDLAAVPTVCPYCGVGCAVTYYADRRENRIAFAAGRPGSGNDARLCVKGRYGFDYATHAQRLTHPLIRREAFYPKGPLSSDVRGEGQGGGRAGRAGNKPGGLVDYAEVLPAFREASWDEALDLCARRLGALRDAHGPGALAGFGSAKGSNEEAYLFQKLLRAGWGTNNVDHCTRLCHASSVAALLETIGSGAVTNVFGDVRRSDVVLCAGTNTTANHPVAASFFKQAAKAGTQIVVVDPRQPDLAQHATYYCRIRSGTDVPFYNALMHVIVAEGLYDAAYVRDHTEGFEALRAVVAQYAPEKVAPIVGLDAAFIREVAHVLGGARAMMIFWGMGISQHTHGTDNARCLIALALLTGSVGRPGTGLHPLRGQNNVQGASDAGLIPMFLPDYQSVKDETVRARFEKIWGRPIDPRPGLTVVEITRGALEGRIKGMYMMGENPFLSDPNINKVRKALAHLEFLVVQDIFLTETAEFADVVLPASSFFEKTGTYTNTDRRVQLGRPVLELPGEARCDWEIICDLSRRMGYPMDYASPAEVFAEFADLTQSYRGLTHDNLGPGGKLWPCADPVHSDGEQILFGDGFPTPSGRGRLVPAEFQHAKEMPDDEYPMVLNTGRLLEHWHTGSMTRRSVALDAIEPEPFVEMHPDDAAALGIADGQLVRVSSRRGAILLPVRLGRRQVRGAVFVPFHFREAAANVLTIDELDPFGKIPEFKFCAVKVQPAA